MVSSSSANLDLVFGALSDPTRRAIVAQLISGEQTVGKVAKPFSTSLPAITKHLNVLENAGLISRKSIGRQKICRIEPEGVKLAMDWMETYRQFWNERLDKLEKMLETSSEANHGNTAKNNANK